MLYVCEGETDRAIILDIQLVFVQEVTFLFWVQHTGLEKKDNSKNGVNGVVKYVHSLQDSCKKKKAFINVYVMQHVDNFTTQWVSKETIIKWTNCII